MPDPGSVTDSGAGGPGAGGSAAAWPHLDGRPTSSPAPWSPETRATEAPSSPAHRGVHLDGRQPVLVDLDLGLAAELLLERLQGLAAPLPQDPGDDLLPDLGVIHLAIDGLLAVRELDHVPPAIALHRTGDLTPLLQLEGRLDDRLGHPLVLPGEIPQVTSAPPGGLIDGVFLDQCPELPGVIAFLLYLLEHLLRCGLILDQDVGNAHHLRLVVLRLVLLVVGR